MFRVLVIFAAFSTQQALATCLSYTSAGTTIGGVLEQHTFPGRPNFEDIRAGDEPETGFYLSLATPVCISGSTSAQDAPPLNGVTRVQLVFDHGGYEALRPFLGKFISVKGVLFAAHTGHHHAPLLMQEPSLVTGK